MGFFLPFVLLIGCSKDEKPELTGKLPIYSQANYAYWEWYNCSEGPIKIFHPPNHPHENQFDLRCQQYNFSINDISSLLAMEPPPDTLVIFYYTGYGQGREWTGSKYPFTQDSIIHFWVPSFIGPTLVDWLLPYWSDVTPRYPLYRHGLRALFDFSGQNYHLATYKYIKDGDFIPLDSLVKDTTIDSDAERYQSAEAASFIGYVLADYGPLRLKTMYESDQPFDQMIRTLFHLPIDSVQNRWLEFMDTYVPDSLKAE